MNQISLAFELIKSVSSLVEDDSSFLSTWNRIREDKAIINLITDIVQSPFHDSSLDKLALEKDLLSVLPILRRLRACYSQPITIFTGCLVELAEVLDPSCYKTLAYLNNQTLVDDQSGTSLSKILIDGSFGAELLAFSDLLEKTNPHALFPTSSYRESTGSVVSQSDDQAVEAVMSHRTLRLFGLKKIYSILRIRHSEIFIGH